MGEDTLATRMSQEPFYISVQLYDMFLDKGWDYDQFLGFIIVCQDQSNLDIQTDIHFEQVLKQLNIQTVSKERGQGVCLLFLDQMEHLAFYLLLELSKVSVDAAQFIIGYSFILVVGL